MCAYLPLLPLVDQKEATVNPKTFPFSVASIFLYHKNLGQGVHVSLVLVIVLILLAFAFV